MIENVYFNIFIVCLVGAMSPGPSLLVILQRSVNYGRFVGGMMSFGHALGVGVYALFVVLGISIFLHSYSFVYYTIKILGALFLFWLGFSFFRVGIKKKKIDVSCEDKHIRFNGFFDGFLLALLNPKIIIWFLALFSQFVDFSPNLDQQIMLVGIPFLVDFFWYLFIVYCVSKLPILNYLNPLNLVSGVLLMGISVLVLVIK